jgi:hypothetical protein
MVPRVLGTEEKAPQESTMPKTADLNTAIKGIVADAVHAALQPYLPMLDRMASFIGEAPARGPGRPRKVAAAAAPTVRRSKRSGAAPKAQKRAKRAPRKVKPAKRAAKASRRPAIRVQLKARKPGGLVKPMQPDAVLAELIGAKPVALSAVVKKIWVHIKDHKLQDPKSGRLINPDEKLATVFGGKRQVSMFEITRLVSKHLS